MRSRGHLLALAVGLAAASGVSVSSARQAPAFDRALFDELAWRSIGPFHGGPTTAAAGVPSQPNVFYAGAANGGVWRTADYGHTWRPIFDDQPVGSIGAIAVAPSDPNTVYVASGEGLRQPDVSTGDGLFKSTDGGRTWAHLGLRDGQQIPQIVVDPRDPNRVFAAVLGHPYGPSVERGIFRSTDGARTFEKVLYRDENTGGVDVALDPVDPVTVYAALWESRHGPWDGSAWSGPGSGVFKSTDGGSTWRPIVSGLPTFAEDGLARIAIAVAPSSPRRLFALVGAERRGGLYRSDDSGETWMLVNADVGDAGAPAGSADIEVDPESPDVVYVAGLTALKSTDAGRTFTAWRGQPGAGGYHRIWINPANPEIAALASNEGAVVTVNGGETWSSPDGQATSKMMDVGTDDAFPYRICGGRRDGGPACVTSRGEAGRITVREWQPIAREMTGAVAPDPNDPEIVYGGSVSRYDRRTGQRQDVAPPLGRDHRTLPSAPVAFSPLDERTLFFASNTLWKTTTGGQTWTEVSPDLSRMTWATPATVGAYRERASAQPARRGAISTIAPSPIDANLIWAGTDDGLVHVTRDAGRSWADVTPGPLVPWASVSSIEASHFDPNTAYAAVNALRLDDPRPLIFRTRDGGRTWSEIVRGLAPGGPINAVREDRLRRGLLFAGSERAVFVSFDDGEQWQSLRLNMPATSVRDLAVKEDDLIAATGGRGLWVLDDIAPLRQITPDVARAPVYLFQPGTAWRVRWNRHADPPVAPEEPSAPNPPDGVTINYLLGAEAAGSMVLEIADSITGEIVRRYTSDDADAARQSEKLAATPGLHRVVWDARHPPPAPLRSVRPDASAPTGAARSPQGMWVQPGMYQVRLIVGGRLYRQAVSVRMDPRVKTPMADLAAQHTLSKRLDDLLRRTAAAWADVDRQSRGSAGDTGRLRAARLALQDSHAALLASFTAVQGADARPTAAMEARAADAVRRAEAALADR